ncbi:DUF6286 domain-containing protein [Streptomyces sp. Q6]|uniref:DUF6286 domain-containing protein n=1 Tax=Streptomyces citrinus TaxID=3118173 RepID=A0ACD5A4Q0_9ACTN
MRKVVRGAALEAVAAREVSASATVVGRRAVVGVRVTLPFPAQLSAATRSVQEHVTARTRALTGLDVPSARVVVAGLAAHGTPPSPTDADADADVGPAGRPPRRWWSQRRRAAGLLLASAAAAAIVCTVDVLRVHAAGEPPAEWRPAAVRWLAGHGPGDPAVTLAGAVAALIGVWLLILALTPGRRRRLTLRTAGDGWCAAIDRSAVAALIRDVVADVPGTQDVKARCGRRTVTVRGEVAFGDCASARYQALRAATGLLAACDLRRPPRLRLALRPAGTWQAPATTDRAGAPHPGDPATDEENA